MKSRERSEIGRGWPEIDAGEDEHLLALWKADVRQVYSAVAAFERTMRAGKATFADLAKQREALGEAPSVERQKALWEDFDAAKLKYHVGALWFSYPVGEAVDEVFKAGAVVSAISQLECVEKKQRLQERLTARKERLTALADRVDLEAKAFVGSVDREEETLKKALPNLAEFAEQWVRVDGPAW